MSIRLRLTLWQTLLVGLVLTGFAVFVHGEVAGQMERRLDSDLEHRADDVKKALFKDYGEPLREPRPGGEYQDLHLPSTVPAVSGMLYFQIVDADGGVVAHSDNLAQPFAVGDDTLRRCVKDKEAFATVDVADESMRVYGKPIVNTSGPDPQILLTATPLSPLRTDISQLRLLLAGIVLGAAALTAIIGWFLAAKAMQPVDHMTQAARAIGQAADFEERIPEPRQRDEIGRLARTFNEMLEQLGATFTGQRRFLADAAHELRTPLTVVRTNVESLLRGLDADPVEREATLRAVVRETDRMSRLVNDLLALARADAGQPLAKRRFALDRLLVEVYQQQKALARDVRLSVGELEQVEVEGDQDRLKQVLLNLVDNALRYTPSGGSVTLDLVADNGSALLRVHDTGSGIAPEHLSRIFDRFYRVDQARPRGVSGTGLGLAIAREVTEAHGGRIEVESIVGHGSTFTVILPAVSASAQGSPPAEPQVVTTM